MIGQLDVDAAVLAQPVCGREAGRPEADDVEGDVRRVEGERSADALVDCSSSKTSSSRVGSIRSPCMLKTDVWPKEFSVLCTLPIARSAPAESADGGRRLQNEWSNPTHRR